MRDSTLPRGCLLLLMLVAATFLVDAASQVSISSLSIVNLKFIVLTNETFQFIFWTMVKKKENTRMEFRRFSSDRTGQVCVDLGWDFLGMLWKHRGEIKLVGLCLTRSLNYFLTFVNRLFFKIYRSSITLTGQWNSFLPSIFLNFLYFRFRIAASRTITLTTTRKNCKEIGFTRSLLIIEE